MPCILAWFALDDAVEVVRLVMPERRSVVAAATAAAAPGGGAARISRASLGSMLKESGLAGRLQRRSQLAK